MGLRWVTGGAGLAVFAAIVAWWPRAVDLATPPPPIEEGFRFVPLDGSPDDGLAGTCAEMVDELVQYPRWELQVSDRSSHCMGTTTLRHVTIAASGWMTWRDWGMPERRVRLIAAELDAVRGLNQLGCRRAYDTDYGERFFELGWGAADTHGGIHIASHTAMGHRLDFIIDRAIARYTEERLAAIRTVTLRFALRRYRLTLDGSGQLIVRKGRRVVVRERLAPQDVVDIVDAVAAGMPVSLEQYGDYSPVRPLVNAIARADDR